MSVGRESIVHLKMQPSLTLLRIMMIDANMNRCKLRLIIPLWECLIQIFLIQMFNSNLPTNRSGSRVSGCALEKSVTVGSRLVLLLSAVFLCDRFS